MSEWMRTRETRVLLRRESLWSYVVPATAAEIGVLSTQRASLVRALSVVYSARDTLASFEDGVQPVIQALSSMRTHVAAGFLVRASRFEAAALRAILDRCAGRSVPTIVELSGDWTEPALEFLVAARPSYVRVGPEYVRGVSALPEGFRRLVRLAEFARAHQVPLVARGATSLDDVTTLRLCGISLLHQPESGAPDDDALAGLDHVEGPTAPAVVLPFPLRPRAT